MAFDLKFWTESLCHVLLCDQNSFGRSKVVLVWPNWFGLDHNDLVMTKMKWSWPKWIGHVQMWFILVENHNLDLTNSIWSWPNHYGQVQISLVRPKPYWTDQNCFGHIEGQDILGIFKNNFWDFQEVISLKQTESKFKRFFHRTVVQSYDLGIQTTQALELIEN